MWTRTGGKGFISATKRGIIKVWAAKTEEIENKLFVTLNKQFEVDARDLGLEKVLVYPPGPAISSVCESWDGKLLFATRRSEIVEIQPFNPG
jgi:hypothetical protein